MDAKLRAYLKREGVSDTVLDKIERGELPDDGVLRKQQANDTPTLEEQLRKVDELLKEIKAGLDRIEKCDRQRAALQNFPAGAPVNGAGHTGLAGIDLKGTNQ